MGPDLLLRRVRRCAVAALATTLAAGALAGPAHAGRHEWKDVADIGQAGLLALALGKSSIDEDWSGAKQLAYSGAATEVVTQGLKAAVHETRPDRSFPSGHTSVSFAAAGYLHQRYGWRWGGPATLAAALVGVARVQ